VGLVASVDTVEIRWPSGTVDTLKNLAADHFYSVLEGKGLVPPSQIKPEASNGKTARTRK